MVSSWDDQVSIWLLRTASSLSWSRSASSAAVWARTSSSALFCRSVASRWASAFEGWGSRARSPCVRSVRPCSVVRRSARDASSSERSAPTCAMRDCRSCAFAASFDRSSTCAAASRFVRSAEARSACASASPLRIWASSAGPRRFASSPCLASAAARSASAFAMRASRVLSFSAASERRPCTARSRSRVSSSSRDLLCVRSRLASSSRRFASSCVTRSASASRLPWVATRFSRRPERSATDLNALARV